ALMPLVVAEIVVLVSSLGCLGLTLWLVLDRLRPGLDRRLALPLVIGALALALYLEPVRQTFGFGQINLVLMAVVALDVLARKPFWPRGMLVGITVSIKLVPGGFLLYFLLRRDWKAAATMIVSAIGAVGVGFLLFPGDSVQYWFHTLADTGRIGPPYFAGNQSLKGLAFRLGVSDGAATAIWLGLAAVAVTLAAILLHHLITAGAHAGGDLDAPPDLGGRARGGTAGQRLGDPAGLAGVVVAPLGVGGARAAARGRRDRAQARGRRPVAAVRLGHRRADRAVPDRPAV